MTLAHFLHPSTLHWTAYIPLLCCLCCLVPNETASQPGSEARAALFFVFGWKNPARDGEPRVWRTGGISRSVTVPSKRNGTSHPPDNSRALVNVLMEDVKRVCGGRETESKRSAAFVFQITLMDLARIKSLKRGRLYFMDHLGDSLWRKFTGKYWEHYIWLQ